MFDPIPTSRRLEWLTPRERVVLMHLAAGLSAEQITAAEHVGMATVRSQITSIKRKLGVQSQLAAVTALYGEVFGSHDERDSALSGVLNPNPQTETIEASAS